MSLFWSKTIAQQAQALEASYAERRAAALAELKPKLLADLGAKVLRKAEEGQQRCIVYFDRIYSSDLHEDAALAHDLNEAEAALLREAVVAWCAEQGLSAAASTSNPDKLTLRWPKSEN